MRLKFIQSLKKFLFAFPSLMLSPQEQIIETEELIGSQTSVCVTLRGMIFQNENAWSLWIDDEKFTPNKTSSKIYPLSFKSLRRNNNYQNTRYFKILLCPRLFSS